MKIWYVADIRFKKKIPVRFNKKENAQKFCVALNEKDKGMFLWGDWIDYKDFMKNLPHDWTWYTKEEWAERNPL